MISRLFEILSRRIDGPLMVALVLTVSLGLTVVYSASGGGSFDRVLGQWRRTSGRRRTGKPRRPGRPRPDRGRPGQGTQSATKTFVSFGLPLCRFEQNAIRRPSGENIGKPSNVGLYVIRSRSVPSTFTAQTSKSRPAGSARFETKRMPLVPSAEEERREARGAQVRHLAGRPSRRRA